ncbi:MAG: hypothetical protein SFU53_13820 [Terrimicrobiaceae bacterium]|nr:hypothetical protein [Terrimicrobiaceae bacterium]
MPGGSEASRPRGFVRQLKDAALSGAAQRLAAEQLAGIAEIGSISLDSANKRIDVSGRLADGGPAFEVHVRHYRLESRAGSLELTIEAAQASPAWMNEILRRFVIGQTVTLLAGGQSRSSAAGAFAKLLAALL